MGYDCINYNGQLRLFKVPLPNILLEPSFAFRNAFGLQNFQNTYEYADFGNATLIKVPESCIVSSGWSISVGNETRGYTSACVNCTSSGLFGWRFLGEHCITDGFYDPNIVTSYEPITANTCFMCAPPNPYYFNISDCTGDDYCYFRLINESQEPFIDAELPVKKYIDTLVSLGGIELGQDDNEFLNIQCISSGRPSLYVFGIHVFDYALWVLIMVGSALVSIAYLWYSVILK
jgi:hypothetical protein